MIRILTICKPTYNRVNVLISDIKNYLSVHDSRFCVKVNDNSSTDNTIELLQQINDDRLIVSQNSHNLGPIRNALLSLKNAKSEYILFLIDKDTIDINLLPEFIDFLEKDKPIFGYVDLNINLSRSVKNFKPGVESIQNLAYLSKHPSGFFWRTDVFEDEIKKVFYTEYNDFDFIFDLINGPIAVKYSGTIVQMPLILNENIRKDKFTQNNKSKGSYWYNANNIYFGKEKRLLELKIYLKSILYLNIKTKDKKLIINKLINRFTNNVTINLYDLMQNEEICSHYHLDIKRLSFSRMLRNAHEMILTFRKEVKGKLSRYEILIISIKYYAKTLIKIIYHLLKRCIIKPANRKSAQ